MVQFSGPKLEEIRSASQKDPELFALSKMISAGWPERCQEIPEQLRPYWNFRDELSIEDCLVPKGERLVIPKVLQPEILKHVHAAHQGIEKCLLRARMCVNLSGNL